MAQYISGENIVIPIHYVNQVVGSLHRHGLSSTRLLADQHIAPDLLQQNGSSVTPEQMSALIQSVASTLDDEMLGFFPQPTRRGFAVFLFRYMLDSDCLSEYLYRGAEFITRFLPPFDMYLSRGRETAVLELREIHPDCDASHAALELFLGLYMRMANWAIDERIRLIEADFTYAQPDHAEYYALLFSGPSNFDQASTRLVFSRKYLGKPVNKNKHDLNHMMKSFPLAAFLRPGEARSVSEQVAGIVYDQLMEHQDLPGIHRIARTLNKSEQTLRRKLQHENTSYRKIKDEVRGKIASHKLTTSEESITEIAFLVGYSDVNNFTRAFKSWYDISPSEYRKQRAAR